MTTVNIYLTFSGNCEEAFNFYRSVFGGEIPYIGRYKDMPPSNETPPLSEEDGNKIMHVSLPIGGETTLMGADTLECDEFVQGNNFSISVSTETRTEAERLFTALSAGGEVTMPLNETFWGAYFGMWTDKFGINWMVSAEEKGV